MIGRLMPWTWWALLLNAVTGSVFVVARPARYFLNPVFGIKFSLLVPAVALAFVVHRLHVRDVIFYEMLTGELPVGRFPPPWEALVH